MASLDSDDDDDFGYDLSAEDEKLLASLADASHSNVPARHHDAASPPGSRARRSAALVGVARTSSVNTFMQRTQPESTPSAIPTDDVQYPDRRSSLFIYPRERACAEQS